MQTMTPGLSFDAATHTYALGGEALPSVTTILRERGCYTGTRFFTEESRERGTRVHQLTELYDQGVLDEALVAPEDEGYLSAWIDYRASTGFEPVLVEQAMASPRYRFAGAIDRLGLIQRRRTLVDLKTGPWRQAYAMQLGAYAQLIREHQEALAPELRGELQGCDCVELRANGTFSVHTLSLVQIYRGWVMFLNALTLTTFIAN